MLELSQMLSCKIPFVRTDFYTVDDRVYFGELTLYPGSGLIPFIPEEWDSEFGQLLELPEEIGAGYAIIGDGFVLYIHFEKKHELTDFKFYCFNGEPRFLYISKGLENHSTASISFVSLDWEFEPFKRNDYKGFEKLPDKPRNFDEMLDVCRKLSAGNRFLRVDLYDINNRIYFSELTFSPNSGFMKFEPELYDLKVGELLDLQTV